MSRGRGLIRYGARCARHGRASFGGRGARDGLDGEQWLTQLTARAFLARMDRNHFFRARRIAKRNRRRLVVPDLGLAVAPAHDDRRMTLMIERGAQVSAIDLRDGARAANIGRDLAITCFDFIANDMTFVADVTIGARIEIHIYFPAGA